MTTEQTQHQTQRKAGTARASGATRGDSGQFLPAGDVLPSHTLPSGVDVYIHTSKTKTKHLRTTKALALKDLPQIGAWWTELAEQYPGVNLHAELLKAMDWHRADRVKSPKLYFRNWIEKAYRQMPAPELTPDQIRARLRVIA